MRAFEYDAFISHNSEDGLKSLAEDLRQRGVQVFCDDAIDLSDRKVLGRIEKALMRSCCVIVHISSKFRDSPRVQAEYRNALQYSENERVQRICVARMNPDNSVPDSLDSVPIFDLPNDIDSLSKFLVESNQIPVEIEAEFEAQKNGSYGKALGTQQNLIENSTRMLEIVSALLFLCESQEVVSGEILQNIITEARYFIDSADPDTRTNAHRELILAAALDPQPDLLQEIRTYICREMDDAVLFEILRLYLVRIPTQPEDTWLSAALLRACSGIKTLTLEHNFLNALSKVVWCRVVQGNLGLLPLPILERVKLLGERPNKLLGQDGQDELYSWGPYEIEGSLRMLLPYLESDEDETADQYQVLSRSYLRRFDNN